MKYDDDTFSLLMQTTNVQSFFECINYSFLIPFKVKYDDNPQAPRLQQQNVTHNLFCKASQRYVHLLAQSLIFSAVYDALNKVCLVKPWKMVCDYSFQLSQSSYIVYLVNAMSFDDFIKILVSRSVYVEYCECAHVLRSMASVVAFAILSWHIHGYN